MKKKNLLILTVLTVCLIFGASLGTAWGYFTTHAETLGYKKIQLGDRTEITEEFKDWTKTLVVKSAEDSKPVYVRAKVIAPKSCSATVDPSTKGWTLSDDGYYYYETEKLATVLMGDAETTPLVVSFTTPSASAVTEFDVVIVYETIPVHFDEEGNAIAPTWDSNEGGQK